MNLKPKIKRSYFQSRTFLKSIITLALLGAAGAVFAATPGGGDPFAAAKTQVGTAFGSGSTFEYVLYVAEVILGAAGYMKTRNLLSLVGLAVVMIFTAVGFSVIG